MGKEYCVISHTHWDREWYQSFENFRIRLVNLIDNLLDILDENENYKFHLDAQTIVLEDYLEIKPQNRKKLKKYISEGRILVGPWYVQSDFFLTSGESTIRNLLIGMSIAKEYGKCTMVGYVPDQFGLISQLPQILAKSGIESCIFGRGYIIGKGYTSDSKAKAEFYWKSEDGSTILAVNLPEWYNNAQRFPVDIDKSMKLLNIIKEKLDAVCTTDYYLLMNGVDHLEAQEDLLPILDEINKRLPEGEKILQDTMPEYIEKLKAAVHDLDVYTGEMRNGPAGKLLTNTLSSRVYLKQMNTKCQTLIESRLEPLYSIAHVIGFREYPSEFLRYLWKLLIKNHPHDSICGCSVDEVHEDMMNRYKRFKEAGEDLLTRGMDLISTYINRGNMQDSEYIITVFNTNKDKRNGVVEMDMDFPEEENVESFCITDENGNEVPYVIVSKEKKDKEFYSPINLPGVRKITTFRVKLWIDEIEGLSYRSYIVIPNRESSVCFKVNDGNINLKNTMENEYLKVEINSNGSVNIYDKESKKIYNNLLLLEDREDIGDAYVYRNDPNGNDLTTSNVKAEIEMIENNPISNKRVVSYDWYLPEGYDFEKNKRSTRLVKIPVNIELSLDKGSRWLDVTIKIDNQVRDHRIRALFPTKIHTKMNTAGSPFDAVTRNKEHLTHKVDPAMQHPNTSYVNVDGDDYGIAVLNEGLHEYENLLDADNTIALTLLRGNDYMMRRITPEGKLNKKRPIPGNQCLGKFTFRLAIHPHKGDFLKAQVAQKAQDYLNPLYGYFQPVDIKKFTGGRPFIQETEIAEQFFRDKKYPDIELPVRKQFIQIDGNDIILSCIKKKERGDSIIVRVYNVSKENREFNIEMFKQIKEAYIVNLMEERVSQLNTDNKAIKGIPVKPKEIVTVEIVL